MTAESRSSPQTPMMKQYREIKNQCKDAILFFRMGDFYEMFEDDAILASRILDIALTSRNKGSDNEVPFCGVPWHSADTYIAKLVQKGYKVAVCEQMESPVPGKKLVKRQIVRTYTPATFFTCEGEDIRENKFLCSICLGNIEAGLAFLDFSSGEFFCTQLEITDHTNEITCELKKFDVKELLIPRGISQELLKKLREENFIFTNLLPDWVFDPRYSIKTLTKNIKEIPQEILHGNLKLGGIAAGAAIHYLKETQKGSIGHIKNLKIYNTCEYMMIDPSTQKHLELITPLSSNSQEATLLSVLDRTKTPMGSRLMKRWILTPLLDIPKIEIRLNAVEELQTKLFKRKEILSQLKGISDMERITTKILMGTANPRDCISLKESLKKIPDLKTILKIFSSTMLSSIANRIDTLSDIHNLIENTINDTPPLHIKEGNIIKTGISAELDELRNITANTKEWIAQMEKKEKEQTGIQNLKVGYNRVFGYFFEIPKGQIEKVPENFIRKQTLSNAERFITPELKEYELRIMGAEEKIHKIEHQLYENFIKTLGSHAIRLQSTSKDIALVDVLSSLAEVAQSYGYTRPKITKKSSIIIEEGRHPIIEAFNLTENFVPNDTFIGNADNTILIITGPNMSGKSTYLRQVALITILAQIGSFVPAENACIGLVDKIFTRIGASDNIVGGESTFMVEMKETANILKNATKESLIILDEVGRGTSTYDGLSIAWAVIEYIHNHIGARTLFATHYHELTQLSNKLKNVKNYFASVKEWENTIIFQRKIMEGHIDKSYGIHVAQLANLPKSVINRAWKILKELERSSTSKTTIKPPNKKTSHQEHDHLEELILDLNKIDINNITPVQALNFLATIKEKFITKHNTSKSLDTQ